MPPRWVVITLCVWALVTLVLTLVVTHFRHKGMTP
jgi:uncharacterized membrane protein